MAPIFVTGISHKSAPVEVREALAIPEAEVSRTIGDLRAAGAVREAMILSTCNRVEVYGAGEREDVADGRLFGLLCERRGIDAASVRSFVYTKVHAEAARHCFRVASSLDSMVVGEPQILGQVKAAFDWPGNAAPWGRACTSCSRGRCPWPRGCEATRGWPRARSPSPALPSS